MNLPAILFGVGLLAGAVLLALLIALLVDRRLRKSGY